MNERMMKNFRIAEQRRKAAEREEQQRILDENEDLSADNEKLQRRVRQAESDYYNLLDQVQVLPDDFTNMVVSKMVARMLEENIAHEHLEPAVQEFMRRLLIRMDRYRGPMGVEVELKQSEKNPVITVRIPEMRLTQILDDLYLQSVVGGKGPYIMEDRPVRVMERDPAPYTKDNATAALINSVKTI